MKVILLPLEAMEHLSVSIVGKILRDEGHTILFICNPFSRRL